MKRTRVVDVPDESKVKSAQVDEVPKVEVLSTMTYKRITVSFVQVTPELATWWLQRCNLRNRAMRGSRRESYARDMLAGNWMFNGDTVCFAGTMLDGTILDGQHRARGVQESGTTQVMLVVEGLPVGAQETIDIGAVRAVADALSLRGEINTTSMAAIARRLCYVRRGTAVQMGGIWRPSQSEILAFIDADPDAIRRAANVAAQVGAARLPVAPSVIGTAYFLAAEKDFDDAHTFFVVKLIDSVGLEKDEPAWTLQQRFKQAKAINRADGRPDQPMDPELAFRYTILAWNHYRRGTETLSRLIRPRGGWPPYSDMIVE